MTENIEHCPFLNRADRRCAKHLNMSHLDHAMEFCFDRFEHCAVYMQRNDERRQRVLSETSDLHPANPYAVSRLIQVKVSAGYQKQSA